MARVILIHIKVVSSVLMYLGLLCGDADPTSAEESPEFVLQTSALVKPMLLDDTCGTATAAKSLQSCPTLCDPIDGSPTGSPVPGVLQARTLEWVAISFSSDTCGSPTLKLLQNMQFYK